MRTVVWNPGSVRQFFVAEKIGSYAIKMFHMDRTLVMNTSEWVENRRKKQ